MLMCSRMRAGGAAEHHLAQPGMAVAAHDQKIRRLVAGLREQALGDAAAAADLLARSALTSCRVRWATSPAPGLVTERPRVASTTRTNSSAS